MYILLLIGLLGLAAWMLTSGVLARSRRRAAAGISLGVAALGLFAFASFWGELLWFDALGQEGRFWRMVLARVGAFLFGVLAGGAGVALLSRSREYGGRLASRLWPPLLGALGGALWGLESWDEILLFVHRVSTGLVDPVLGRDTGFYLFVLPLLDQIFWLAAWIVGVGLLAALAGAISAGELAASRLRRSPDAAGLHPVSLCASAVGVVIAYGLGLEIFHVMYSHFGVVLGAGWTDIHVRLPALVVVALFTLLLAVTLLLPAFRSRWRAFVRGPTPTEQPIRLVRPPVPSWRGLLRGTALAQTPELLAVLAAAVSLAAVGAIFLAVLPLLSQWLVVEPNEITLERPYLENNIRFTQRGFGLHEVEDRQFPAADRFTPEMVAQSEHLLSEIRLWDWRALDAVYKQFQEIRLYYEFYNVDMDRYMIGGRYRQVMVSARELTHQNLPEQSQTFVNRRFKYTHGYGVTLSTVSDFTPDGRPHLLVKDIPPRAEAPELQVTRPEIYYGELTRRHAVVNTREAEFDYPSGDQNIYTRYSGKGGVLLSSWWRRFVFGWKFDGTQFLLSTYPTAESRILFHRQVRRRVATLAPFLRFDSDPYIVLSEGRLFWIIDGYTTSAYYPYSEPFASREVIEYREQGRPRRLVNHVSRHLNGANYVRNSVKAVVDAFEGSVAFYVFTPGDPVIQVWQSAFPGLFQSSEAMPPGLRVHIRYPESMLLAQGLVYAKYHMSDPEVFYNQEDLWVRATEKYYADVRPVDPYYVMWELPDSDVAEFVSVLPFTPRHRQVLIGWLAGLCDGENYGRLLAYKFPKEKLVLGPQQVETKIDQHPDLSAQLTLWDQRGSSVIRGNVLAIPIEDTFLYVEPIYLRADTAAYPELRVVVVMHGDTMSYADTLEEALAGLFDGAAPDLALASAGAAPRPEGADSLSALARQANTAFESYLEQLAQQRFESAGRELQTLRDLLARMSTPEVASPPP